MSALIEFEQVCKYYQMGDTLVKAADHITMKIEKGEFVAIVGQSGSGKSTCMNIIGCLDVPTYGTYRLNGRDVGKMNRNELAAIRNEMLGFIFQQYNLLPKLNLMENVEVPLVYAGISRADRHVRAREVLEQVGLGDKLKNRPNQLSGGMRQRVMIAIALACEPKLLIADEPTTALDVTIQAQILELMQDLRKKLGMSIIMITHDLGVVASMCEKIAVMYAGHIVEYGTTDEIFYQPGHEYTKGLINSIPKLNTAEHERLVPIEGTPVDLLNPPAGCPFAPRCKNCMKICLSKMPPRTELSDTHYTYCWLQQKAAFEKGEKAE